MVVAAALDLDLGLDAPEEGRRRMEDQPVGALPNVGKVADAAVVIGLALGDELVPPEELDTDAAGGFAPAGVEDVRRDHTGNLLPSGGRGGGA